MKDFYGPWTFELSTHEVHDKDGDLIVDVDSGDFLKEKSADLGLLIAAAPDLLKELQRAAEVYDALLSDGYLGYKDDLIRVSAAIAKALGESK